MTLNTKYTGMFNFGVFRQRVINHTDMDAEYNPLITKQKGIL